MNCNCLLGCMDDYDYIPLNRNTIADDLRIYVGNHNRMVDEGFETDRTSLIDYFDEEKNMISRYHYCPYCGEKINWKAIKIRCLDG